MFLVCQETVAVVKEFNIMRRYETYNGHCKNKNVKLEYKRGQKLKQLNGLLGPSQANTSQNIIRATSGDASNYYS